MKLDLNFELKDLHGNIIADQRINASGEIIRENVFASSVVANLLTVRTKMSVPKAMSYAIKLNDHRMIEEISQEDIEEIKSLLSENNKSPGGIANIVCHQITEALDQASVSVS